MLFAASLLLFSACTEEQPFEVPEGFPGLRVPDDNPLTAAKIELGRYLFYDTRLSRNETQSCASCHEQARAFTDAKALPTGSEGEILSRNSQSLVNVGYNATLTWANPILVNLEAQILIPLSGDNPVELGANEDVFTRFEDDPLYDDLFAAAFPEREGTVDAESIVNALASFCRAIVSGNSRFDAFTYQGQDDALNDDELAGMMLFYSERLECQHCHGGFNFSEATVHENTAFDSAFFHNNGLYNIDGEGAYPADNTGIFELTLDPADMGKFRAPTLRNIEVTGPYMHDGSIETLEEVIRHYERGGREITEGPYAGDGKLSPLKSGLVAGFSLTDTERDQLIAFLMTLTDEEFLQDPSLSNPFEEP